MKERNIRVSDSCQNCEHRMEKVYDSIFCKIDMQPRNKRLVCDDYKRTSSNFILSKEDRLLTK